MPDTTADPALIPAPVAAPVVGASSAAEPPAAVRDTAIAPYVGLHWRAGLLLSVSLWCYLAMAELSRLSADRLDATDRSWPFVVLLGPSSILHADGHGWVALGATPDPDQLAGWLVAFVLVDLILLACLARIGLHLLAPLPGRRPIGRTVVWVTVAVQLLENVLALLVAVALFRAGPTRGVPGGLADVLAFVTGLKWLVLALTLAGLARKLFSPDGAQWRHRIRRLAGALVIHRFSLLPVVPVAALVLPSGPNIADQVPDVQRRWLDGWIGLAHGTAATVALLVLTLVVFVIGRLRCDWVWRRRVGTEVPHRPAATLWLWLVGPAMVVGLAVIAALSDGQVLWARVVYFCAPLVLVAAVSWWLRRTRPPMLPSSTRTYPVRSVLTAIRAGDALALSVVVIGGLGLARAFIAPAFLYPGGDRVRSWLLLGLSAVAVVVPWLVEERVRRRLDLASRSRVAPTTLRGRALRYFAQSTTPGIGTIGRGRVGIARLSIRRFRRLLVVLSLGTFGLLGVAPVAAARIFGVVACLILALMAVTTIASTMLVMTQEHAPPEAFRLIIPNLRTTPIVTVLLGIVVFAATIGQSSHLHDLRGLADSPSAAGLSMPARPVLVAATDTGAAASVGATGDTPSSFATWLADPAACRSTVDVATAGGTRQVVLRPMVMLAADGGGIRSAFWTASAVQRLSAAGAGCGNSSTLFSGGASGGSVGLAVASNTTTPVTDVTAMSGPAALGAGAVGMTVRDLFVAATGVGLPVFFSDDVVARNLAPTAAGTTPRIDWSDRWTWLDRAGLIESVWETVSPSMRQPFVGSTAAHGATGRLVLTSTSVGTGCRVLVSQDTLLPGVTGTPGASSAGGGTLPACTGSGVPAASSFDLLDEFGATAPAAGSGTPPTSTEARCIAALANSTAGMATARFPYVTPSGDVGPCRGRSGQQLVDGGYTENSGIGTVVDLASSWLAAVRAVNGAAARTIADPSTAAAAPPQVLVPIVVYLVDDGGRDVAAPPAAPTAEALVPLIANSRAGRMQENPQSLLQRAAALTAGTQLCDPSIPGCGALVTAATTWAPHRVDVVYPETAPAVTAPLGWVLSQGSRDTMTAAMTRQATLTCAQAGPRDPICQRGYGRLADLLALMTVR
jgi:hypothetical protein